MLDVDLLKKWYRFNPSLFEILKVCRDREVVWLRENLRLRPLKIWSKEGFLYLLDKYEVFSEPVNMYISVASLDNTLMPNSVPGPQQMKDNREFLKANWAKLVRGYDFIIEVEHDEGNLEKNFYHAKRDALRISMFYDENKFIYYTFFSGSKSFYFVVPFEYLVKKFGRIPVKKDFEEGRTLIYKKVAGAIAKKLDIKFVKGEGIDSSIYDLRRIFRLPYGIHAKTGLVSLPLSDEQMEFFSIEDFSVNRVLENVKIMHRGLLLREGSYERMLEVMGGMIQR